MYAAACAGARSAPSCGSLRRLPLRPRCLREQRGVPYPPALPQRFRGCFAVHHNADSCGAAKAASGRSFTTTTTGGESASGDKPSSRPWSPDIEATDDDEEPDSDWGSDADSETEPQGEDLDNEVGPKGKDLRVLPIRGEATGGRFSRFGPGREVGEFDPMREEALESMYPSAVPSLEEMLDDSHLPVLKDPFTQNGRLYRCKGKRQGKGALEGTCEIFNDKELHINNTLLLREYVNEAAMILPRRHSGLCAKCSRKVAGTVKHARQAGLLPIVSDFEVHDKGPAGLKPWVTADILADKRALRAARPRPKQQRFGSV